MGGGGIFSRNARPLRISFVLGGLLLVSARPAGSTQFIVLARSKQCSWAFPASPVQKMHSTSPAAPTIQQSFLNLRGTSSSESKFVFTISPPQFAYISTFRYFGQVEREVQGPFSLWPKMCMNSSFLRVILPSSNWRVYV